MKKLAIFISLLVFIALIYLFYSISFSQYIEIYKKFQESKKPDQLQLDSDGNPVTNEDITRKDSDKVASGGAGGESSEESSPSFILDSNGCYISSVSYSLGSFQQNSICNEYDGEICIRKTKTCSAVLNNLDNEISGDFTINFNFVESQSQTSSLVSQTYFLQANSQKTFESSKEFQGQSANQEVSCSIALASTPQKKYCDTQTQTAPNNRSEE